MALSGHLYPKSAILHVIDKTRSFKVSWQIRFHSPGSSLLALTIDPSIALCQTSRHIFMRSCWVAIDSPVRVWCVLLFLVSSPSAVALGQAAGLQDPTATPGAFEIINTYRTAPGTCVLVFTLFAERNGTRLDRQAVLKLENVSNHAIAVAVTDDAGKGVFTDVPLGSYELDASAVGYLTQHRDMNVIDPQRPIETQLILKHDPNAVNLDVAASIMSPKARKQAKHAISALKSGNLAAAEKQLDEAYKLSPSSPDVNFLLGYLYFAKKDFD